MVKKRPISEFARELTNTFGDILRFTHITFTHKPDPLIGGTITLQQYIVLDILNCHAILKMKDIAKALRVSLPAVTGLINRLVKLKFVKRVYNKDDRRVIFIEITDLGKKTVKEVDKSRRRMVEKIYGNLSDSERKTYLKIIRKVRNILYEKHSTA